ncbi:MAG: S53 family peptidase [Planctomycetaceae bacterium]|nr:S53 family peptidase [Planctomycetaceae bacterium]
MTAHSRRAFRPILSRLDDRCLLSGLTPAQMCQAYGINSFHFVSQGKSIPANGSGETIAIVDAYHDPNLFRDVQTFDRNFNLPDPQISQYWYGTSSDDGWATEECLDVEWAHAIAPGAKIVVVEARSASGADLTQAVDFARHQPGVVAVSMSFGSPEVQGDSQFDSLFTTPSGHTGITFLASTGDDGAWPGAQYEATSPNVLAVGGTTLSVDSRGDYLGETGWSGSGGGISRYEAEPWYQYRVQTTGHRTIPDVSMDADPNTGCYIYCTAPSTGRGGWGVEGGTSAATPMWAGLIAIADQGRAVIGKGSLDGPTQTLPAIYSAQMDGDFHEITSGFNGYYAGPGYNLVTGRGSPIAFNVVRDLMQVSGSVSTSANAASAKSAGANLSGGMMTASTSVATPFTPAATPAGVPTAGSRAVRSPVIAAPAEAALPVLVDSAQPHGKSRAALHHDLALDALQQDDFDLPWVA